MDQFDTKIEDIKKIQSVINSSLNTTNSFIPMQTKKESKQVKIIEPIKNKPIIQPNIQLTEPKQNSNDEIEILDSHINSSGDQISDSSKINKVSDNTLFFGSSQFITLFGLTLPRHTFYLIIVLIILGIAIWYLNSDIRKNKRKILEHDEDK